MSRTRGVLVVDDEKNIRTTLVRALEAIGVVADTAATGEEALEKLARSRFELMLLDLRLPGLDGIEVLRRALEMRPEIRVVVITAHGTVAAAVRAMKLGAFDFMEKPFSPEEIREVVRAALDTAPASGTETGDYEDYLAEVRRRIHARQLEIAANYARRAIGVAPTRPEAFNLLGVATALRNNPYRAQDYFRASLALDPTYVPAQKNLERGATIPVKEKLLLGDGKES